METLLQDVRYGATMMRRNPGFAAAALLTLALGVGATTAVFSVVYGVLLRPLPYPDADRIVQLSEEHPGAVSPLRDPMLSNLTFYTWRESPRTVESIAAYHTDEETVTLDGVSARLACVTVTPDLFGLIGASPAAGRFFAANEGEQGNDAVMVISDRMWRERFGASPSAVGRSVTVDGKPRTIVGIARPGFSFPTPDTMYWKPYVVTPPDPAAVEGTRGRVSVVFALARLKPGFTPEQAAAEGTAAARALPRPMATNLLFGVGGPVVVHVRSLVGQMTMRIRPAILVLAAAVVLLLLVACANVANLFLSRGVARQRELAVRAAIGASGGRLARQLLTESFVLSAIGGACGVALAWGLVTVARSLASKNFPRLDDIRVDGRVLAFAAVAAVASALLSGLAPAVRGTRFNLSESIHSGGEGASAGGFRGARSRRLRDVLLVAEAAFAVVLLVGAMLLSRSFVRLTHVDAGYDARNVLAVQIFVPGDEGTNQDRIAASVDTLLSRVRGMSGVVAAGAGNMMPLDNATMIAGFPVPGQINESKPKLARAISYTVTPGYAEALGLRLRGGRLFAEADRNSGTRHWIVNEEFARLYLDPNPVGFQFRWRLDDKPVNADIAGLVGNVLKNGNDTRPQPEIYAVARDGRPFTGRFELAIRAETNPAPLAPVIRQWVTELEPSAAVETIPLEDRVAASVEQPRFAATVLVAFAALALALASVGLYGVLSYGVSQRRRELGVRAALGASRVDLIELVLRQGLGSSAAGLAIGLAAAAGTSHLMQGVLFGVAPLDAWTFTVAPIVLLSVAIAACLVPAMRAAAASPSEALRSE